MEVKVNVYSDKQHEDIAREFSRLKGNCYLDHAGATMYSEKQLESIFSEFSQNIYSNPHGRSSSSHSTIDSVDIVRYMILDHFKTNPEEYSVIFTSGATGALKSIADTFDFNGDGTLAHLEDNHTSVLGMRALAPNVREIKVEEAFSVLSDDVIRHNRQIRENVENCLFVYPAQSNFAGTKYPLSWINKVQNGGLDSGKFRNWFVALDAASFVSTNDLNLTEHKPDFVTISFYKIFGYPTGLGALLVRKTSERVLKKKYLGGGTVLMALSSENVMIPRPVLHERFEDGTLSYLSIISVRHGFDTIQRLGLTFDLISQHTFRLAKYLYSQLLSLHHRNGVPVAQLYHDSCFESRETQGGIVNFNLKRDNGDYVGYAEVMHIANLHGIHLRTGCFCNPGACQRLLKLTSNDVRKQFDAGHVCGDEHDLINGYPTGSVRVSFGYMSTYEDVDELLSMIENCFISKPVVRKSRQLFPIHNPKSKRESHQNGFNVHRNGIETRQIATGRLEKLYVYPIKSCGPYCPNDQWELTDLGLKFDRRWMVVSPAGTCLSQKQNKRMCLISPILDIKRNKLIMSFKDGDKIEVPLELSNTRNEKDAYFCQSKVCGDKIQGWDCGDAAADWLSEKLQFPGLRLLRQCEFDNGISGRRSKNGESRLSLANKAQFLLVNFASVQWLKGRIPDDEQREQTLDSIVLRFRPNLVVDFDEPFVENSRNAFLIGNIKFQFAGQCTRCQMICIDQRSGEISKEPLQTLSREFDGKIRFGVYLSQEFPTEGEVIKVGCRVLAEGGKTPLNS